MAKRPVTSQRAAPVFFSPSFYPEEHIWTARLGEMKHRVSLLQSWLLVFKGCRRGGRGRGASGGAQPLNWQMSAQRPGLGRVGGRWQMPISALHLPSFVHHQRNPNMGHTQWTLAVE